MAVPQCCYLAKGAKRPSHTTNTITFDRIPFDPCNSIRRFDLCPFDQKNSTYLQPPLITDLDADCLPRPLSFSLAEYCTKQDARSEVDRSATAHLLIPPPGCENLRGTHLPLWWTCRREQTSWSFLCQKRGTFLEAPQPQYSRETGPEFHQSSLIFETILSDPNTWKAPRWNYPSALGGRQAISLGCYLCRSTRPQQNREQVCCQRRMQRN